MMTIRRNKRCLEVGLALGRASVDGTVGLTTALGGVVGVGANLHLPFPIVWEDSEGRRGWTFGGSLQLFILRVTLWITI